MENRYSGKQVIKAGEDFLDPNLFRNEEAFNKAMDVLSFWRYGHNHSLEAAFSILQEAALKKDKNAIFAKRLKRFISIIQKLRRFEEEGMKLRTMQDIGGCRVVITNEKKLLQIVRELKKKSEFKTDDGKIKFKDYISRPKDDGYRGYHMVGKFLDSEGKKKNIEIQLRTKIQHYWATALEIVDLFTGQALKSNQGDEDWKQFFLNTSEQFSIMDNIHIFETLRPVDKFKRYKHFALKDKSLIASAKLTKKYCKKLRVLDNLDAFANSIKIIDGKIDDEPETGYILLEINTITTTVTSILFRDEDNKVAEERYIESEKKYAEKEEIIVALVSTSAVGDIKTAYPNYFADSTEFLRHLNFIMKASI